MAKFKASKPRKSGVPGSYRGLVPCLIVVLAGFAIIGLLFYLVLNS